MKKITLALVIVVAAVAGGCSTRAVRSVDPAVEAAVRERVASRDYTVYFDLMSTSRGRPIPLSHPWNIRIAGDSVYSYLPYVGEAYTPVIGRQEGLNFDGTLNDYKQTAGRRGEIEIEFWAMTFEDRYDFRLTVYPSGSSYLWVTPDRKSTVSFDGKLEIE
jgi:hypothetical protein